MSPVSSNLEPGPYLLSIASGIILSKALGTKTSTAGLGVVAGGHLVIENHRSPAQQLRW